ncbi:unnamed protein product [Linum tenue]|uniref:H15 domain-containing protein n=1 Tax=Linum tenue TaxID=586396 RepID=A0AAV0JUM5_9ROSI|nr:unnamed protein product [Linum tenue]
MDPHPLHNPLQQWVQPPPTAGATATYSTVTFSDAAGLQPHNYVSQHSFPNFPPQAGPTPVLFAPSAASAPTPTSTATTVQGPAGFQPSRHPNYAEMIYAALTALKERDGSSKRAITKFLEHAYPGQLPPNHADLLADCLKELKSKGMVEMVKKSYKLRGSGSTTNINDLPDLSLESSVQPPPPPPPTQQSAEGPLSPSVGPKRGRGRPPKAKPTTTPPLSAEAVLPNGQPEQHVSQPVVDSLPPGFSANGQPTTGHYSSSVDGNVNMEEQVQGATQPVTVPIGVTEEDGTATVKRGRGRPPKNPLGVDASGLVIGKRGRGRPPKSALGLSAKKRSPGRPRKPKPKTVAAVSGANGYKRRPGRPPKNQANSVAVPYANLEAMPLASVPRPRGRPRKGTGSIAAGVGVGMLLEKHAGPNDGISEPRRSGRPVGRPRKYADESGAESDAQGEEDYRRKLVFFQSQVKRVVGVLRPMLSGEAPKRVVDAVEDLEGLASIDIDQELKEELAKFNLHLHDVEAEVGEV